MRQRYDPPPSSFTGGITVVFWKKLYCNPVRLNLPYHEQQQKASSQLVIPEASLSKNTQGRALGQH